MDQRSAVRQLACTSSRDQTLHLSWLCQGYPSNLTRSIDNLGTTPESRAPDHHGQYGMPTFNHYKELAADLRRKRRALGISQEDLNDAGGLADGHIAKLEPFARAAQFPTFQL